MQRQTLVPGKKPPYSTRLNAKKTIRCSDSQDGHPRTYWSSDSSSSNSSLESRRRPTTQSSEPIETPTKVPHQRKVELVWGRAGSKRVPEQHYARPRYHQHKFKILTTLSYVASLRITRYNHPGAISKTPKHHWNASQENQNMERPHETPYNLIAPLVA